MIKVIGDIMLDRWILGTADRMSPEAPVPVLKESYQTFSVGGAGNLALNLGNLKVDLSLHGSAAPVVSSGCLLFLPPTPVRPLVSLSAWGAVGCHVCCM